MFDAGFVDEVRRLLDAGLADGRTARTAIGYREVAAYLAGETTLDEAIEATTTATRRFSRRQDSWFRKDPRVVWVRGTPRTGSTGRQGPFGTWADQAAEDSSAQALAACGSRESSRGSCRAVCSLAGV